ncbi:hypothetical protein [Nocardioides sp. R-C-SC26]|uniref:hypothetical protein n=1 Tax=Nocardioides sp. R-C-SC26 TaxID=2870414 RepID=UPI001E30AA09|nr:hypothetical protein [Nocardioides sp. R-C-SC26]
MKPFPLAHPCPPAIADAVAAARDADLDFPADRDIESLIRRIHQCASAARKLAEQDVAMAVSFTGAEVIDLSEYLTTLAGTSEAPA